MAKIKSGGKKAARELAFQILYSLVFTPAHDLEDLQKAFMLSPHKQQSQKDILDTNDFSWQLVEGVWNNENALNEMLKQYSLNWRIEQIGSIELILLRLSLYEMLYKKTPVRVVISQYMELADQFGVGHANGFINGVLIGAAKHQLGEDKI